MITASKSFGSYILSKPSFSISETDLPSKNSGPVVSTGCSVPSEWTSLKLISVRKYNHDTSIFKFRLPLGLVKKLNLSVFFIILSYTLN